MFLVTNLDIFTRLFYSIKVSYIQRGFSSPVPESWRGSIVHRCSYIIYDVGFQRVWIINFEAPKPFFSTKPGRSVWGIWSCPNCSILTVSHSAFGAVIRLFVNFCVSFKVLILSAHRFHRRRWCRLRRFRRRSSYIHERIDTFRRCKRRRLVPICVLKWDFAFAINHPVCVL